MNRDIKFRLLDENYKIVGFEKWRNYPCWLYSKDGENYSAKPIKHRYKDQFSGLLDKEGKDIYEMDIVKYSDWRPKIIFFNDKGFAGFSLKDTELFLSDFDAKEMEVIGNLYENPELLNDI